MAPSAKQPARTANAFWEQNQTALGKRLKGVSKRRKRSPWSGAMARCDVCFGAARRRFASSQRLHIGGGQWLAANAPVAALDFVDGHPGHRSHVFPFNGNHRLRECVDDLALL